MKGMKMRHVRTKDIRIADAVSFKAGERELVDSRGVTSSVCTTMDIQIGDTFTSARRSNSRVSRTLRPNFSARLAV